MRCATCACQRAGLVALGITNQRETTVLWKHERQAGREHRVAGLPHRRVVRLLEAHGTLPGEHGIGLLKKQFMELNVGPDALAVMRAIKDALDPLGIMNPGKVFPAPGGAGAFEL